MEPQRRGFLGIRILIVSGDKAGSSLPLRDRIGQRAFRSRCPPRLWPAIECRRIFSTMQVSHRGLGAEKELRVAFVANHHRCGKWSCPVNALIHAKEVLKAGAQRVRERSWRIGCGVEMI